MRSSEIVYLADEVDDDLESTDSDLDLALVSDRDSFGPPDDDMFRSLYEDPGAILRARR